MTDNFYHYALTDRRRMMADSGFVRDDLRVWSHLDGRAIGESVAAALTDDAFLRFMKIETAYISAGELAGEGAETVASHSAQ